MEVEQLSYLPHEIIAVILLRLPVKPLLQFKSVCKRWYSLICDPQFVRMHLNQVFRQRERIMFSSNPFKVVNPVYFMDYDGFYPLERIDFPLIDTVRTGLVYGSCNGLVLIVGYEDSKMLLWNPSMRESREIPPPHWSITDSRPRLYGLGYDSSTDDYKLALFIFESRFMSSSKNFVFSLKANRWKKKSEICKYQPGNHQIGQAAVVNGALHWVMQERSVHSVTCYNKVVYFDLADEKWKDMLLPDLDMGRRRLTFHLGVLGGCLCVLGVDRTSVNRSAFVWVMKEYGVMESWTNVINFSYNEPSHRIAPFCFTKDGVIVLEIGGENKLLVVNCERNTIRSVSVRTGYAMPITNVESLVSVYGGNGSLKRCLKRKK
ncbi:hypothetical protein LguiA_031850 [Lonicera macranthoides]